MGEPNSDGPFDEFGLHTCHLASQIGNVGLRRDIRQVNIDRLLDGRCEGFGLGVGEAGGREALDCLVGVEGRLSSAAQGISSRGTLSPLEFGDEEDLAAFADRLEIGGLMQRAVDGDGGFLFEMVA